MDILELLHYTFFRHALLGSLFASIACGIIGTYIVTRRLVFISGGITHASFGGIGLGLYAGISPLLSAAVFSVLSAFGVEWLSKRKDMREDSAIAVFWTFGMAVGIIFSFLAPGFTPDLSAFLFGNILTITPTDIWMLATLSVLLILFFTLFLNPIIYIAFDREFARSQRIPVAIPKRYIVRLAKNFPSTTPVKRTGAVNKSCSVLCFRSSLNSFIVKSGTRKMAMENRLEKT